MQRRLAAILAADMVAYSRLVSDDESSTLERQKAHRKDLIEPVIAAYNGRIVKTTGDGFLAEFSSVVDAVNCAVEIQRKMRERENDIPETSRIRYRIGINLGEIVFDDNDIFGDGVNIAARLEGLAQSGGLCISDIVHENLRLKLDFRFDDLGERPLKNIARKIRVWQWNDDGAAVSDAGTPQVSLAPENERTSIIVLPFVNMSNAEGSDHLADGITEDLTTALSKIESLYVVSHTSAFARKGHAASTARIGEKLNVQYVVEGSIRTARDRVRINAQLIETNGGGHLWAEKFDGAMDGVFEFQDEIIQKVVSALEVRLSEGEQVRLWRQDSKHPLAYEHFLRGRANAKLYTRTGNVRAKQEFQTALEITPDFTSAIVGLARAHIDAATYAWSPDRKQSLTEAKRLLDRALALDENHVLTRVELAHYLFIAGDYEAAHKMAARAIAIDPNLAEVQNVAAFTLLCLNQPHEALRHARKAIELNPAAPEFYLIVKADAYMALGRFADALPLVMRILVRRPSWIMAKTMLAICYEATNQHSQARHIVSAILEMNPRFTVARWRRCLHNPDRADTTEAARMLRAAGLHE